MASGDIVGVVLGVMPPGSSYATFDVRVGGSTPTENVPVWEFDAATDEWIDVLCVLHGYDGGGLTVRFRWMAATATSGTARIGIGIRRVADDAEDIDSSHTYDPNTGGFTAPSASGEVAYDSIAFTTGADMDSLADGETFVLRFYRDADGTSGTDDMTGDLQLIDGSITIEET